MRKLQIATIAVLLSLCSVVGVREMMASGGGHASQVASTIAAPIPGS